MNLEQKATEYELFDKLYYIKNNTDIKLNKTNAFRHYIEKGWKEFRNPSENFNTWWYIARYLKETNLNINPIKHFIEKGKDSEFEGVPADNYRLSINNKTKYNNFSIEFIKTTTLNKDTAHRIAKSNVMLKQHDIAMLFYQEALKTEPYNEELINEYANLLIKNKSWNNLFSLLNGAIEYDNKNPGYHLLNGIAYKETYNFNQAVKELKIAITLRNKDVDPNWYYLLGLCEELNGNKKEAQRNYKETLNNSTETNKKLGIGIYHERNENLKLAAIAYNEEINLGNKTSILYQRLAKSYEKKYNFEESLDAYKKALDLDSGNLEIQYKIGHVYEKLGQYDKAAKNYQLACGKEDITNNVWLFRLAYSLYKSGKKERACEVWIKTYKDKQLSIKQISSKELKKLEESLEVNFQNTEIHYKLGLYYLQSGMPHKAATSFQNAIERRSTHAPMDHYYLGLSLYKIKNYSAACESFKEMKIFKDANNDSNKINKTKYDIKAVYAEYIDNQPVNKNLILYQSYHGSSFSCNPYAIFKYLIESKEYKNLTHIVVVKDQTVVKKKYVHLKNVIFVEIHSYLYAKYLATAKFLINNTTFLPYFVRRKEQVYLNTWHGTPIKCNGKKIPNNKFEYKNTTRNILQYTHLIYPNKHLLESVLIDNQAEDLFSGNTSFTGYPRIDLMINATNKTKEELIKKYEIDKTKPTLLYVPTWRGNLSNIEFDTSKLIRDIEILSELPINLFFKSHNFVQEKIKNLSLNAKSVENCTDINEFLAITDILVTDYSSIFFDFLPAKKPIIFYTYDYDKYINERQLYFDIKSMPGTICNDIQSLELEVNKILNNKWQLHKNHKKIQEIFCSKEDGKATKRAVDFLFNNKEADIFKKTKKIKLLVHAGTFSPNGLTNSLINLINSLPSSKFSINIVLDPWLIESYPNRIQRYSELPENINVLPRVSFPVATPEEMRILDIDIQPDILDNKYLFSKLKKIYTREFERLYGENKFDVIIDYSGYNIYWASLFSLATSKSTKKLLWLHNDMIKEMHSRAPHLRSILSLCNSFDYLVSVSKSIHHVNKKNISNCFGIDQTRFKYATNCVLEDKIKTLSLEQIDCNVSLWAKNTTLFGAFGRLSREKGFDRLIKAFKEINSRYPNTKLIIVGEGPEKNNLKKMVQNFNLQNYIWIYGHTDNPYPLIKFVDLLVCSSRYEGLGMVILERLVFKKPLISTSIPGPKDILDYNKDMLVPSNTDGLIQGMDNFMKNKIKNYHFKLSSYNEKSLNKITNLITN